MPIIGSLLPEEDLVAYRRAHGLSDQPSALPDSFQEEAPDWRDQLEVLKYQRGTQSPETLGETLAMSMFNKDRGRAAERRFADNLDQHYINDDGTFKANLWKQDNFVLDVEKAYYENRGKVPLEWLLQFSEDLDFMSAAYAPEVEKLHQLSLLETQRLAVHEQEVAEFNEDVDFIAEWQEVSRQEALIAWTNFESLYNSFGDDFERGQQALDEIQPGLKYSEMVEMQAMINEHGRPYYAGLSDRRADVEAAGQLFDEAIAQPVGWLVGLVGGAADFAVDHVPDWAPSWVPRHIGGGSGAERGRDAAVKELQSQIGMSDEQFMVQAGFGDVSELWRNLPGVNPEAYRTYVAMAGGDTGLAQTLFADEVLFHSDNREMARKQKEIYDSQLQYQITELKNRNFGTAGRIMDIISAYGEGLEYVATGVTMVGVDALNGEVPTIDAQFFQDIHDMESPAKVLGLDGTLVGMMFDFAATAAVDPTVWVFGPHLNRWGRAGATTADAVTRSVESATADLLRKEIVDVGRGASQNAVSYATVIDNLASIGMAEEYMASMKGFVNPVVGKRLYLEKPIAGAVDDVSYHLLEKFGREVAAKDVAKAIESMKLKGLDNVTVLYNPATRRATIVSGEEIVAGLRELGHDAVPVGIRIDPDAGLVTSQSLADWERALGVVDGRVPVEKVKDLLRYDFRGSADNAALVDDVAERGVEKAIAIAIDPDTGAVTVINGNHRLSAALDAGVTDVPVRVGFKKKLADVPGLPDRSKPLAPKVWDDPPRVADPEWVEVPDWGTIDLETQAVKSEGEIWGRPSDIIGDSIYGPEAKLDNLKKIERAAGNMGADPIQGRRTITGISAAQHIGDLMRDNPGKFVSRMGEFLNTINSNIHFSFNGPAAFSQINQFGNRLWAAARDVKGFEPFQARILEFYRNRGTLKLEGYSLSKEARALTIRRDELAALTGNQFDDMAALGGANPSPEFLTRKASVMEEASKIETRLQEIAARQREVEGGLTEFGSLQKVLDDMMDDFNRKHIATNKQWKDVKLTEDGLVPWDTISQHTFQDSMRQTIITFEKARAEGMTVKQLYEGEAGYLPKAVKEKLVDGFRSGESLDSFLREGLNFLKSQQSWNAPASPLELMAAATGGPSLVRRVSSAVIGQRVLEMAHTAQMLWALDKVLTPRTAITVSLDELVRISHLGGAPAVLKLFEDKAMQISSKVVGTQNLPRRWQERLVALEEYPTFYRQLERSFLEISGVGLDEIKFKGGGRSKNIEYFDAAQRSAGQIMNDLGFQKFMEGEQAFRAWFETDTTAAKLRDMEFFDAAEGATKTGMTADVAYKYYQMYLEEYALKNIKPGKRAKARKLWQEATERSATKGSTAAGPVSLPDWVLEGYGSVTGNANITTPSQGIFNWMSQRLFQSPVNYRRGFLAEWTRKSEMARLNKLYKSQGKRIVSDAEVKNMIKRRNPLWTEDQINANLARYERELFETQNVISESRVGEIVEHKVIAEMEDALYSFQMNSQGGKGVRAIAPFGKPYADMIGHWGRNMLSRPQLRGWINDANFMNMGKIANTMVDNLPFNPKTAGFLSRVAALDLDLDKIQNDPLVGRLAQALGLEGVDVGAAIFLPNSTSNPFGVLFPGLGFLPVGAAQWAFHGLAPDPVDDPLGYQEWVDKWSQFLPGIAYNQGNSFVQGLVNLVAGGGTISRIDQGVEAVGGLAGSTTPGPNGINGSWAGRVEANRYVKTLFLDTDIWEEFRDLPPDLVGEGLSVWLDEKLEEITNSALRRQSFAELKELATEIQVPVRSDYGAANDQLDKAWIDSVDWMGLTVPSYINTKTATGKKQAAEWARSEFFALPDWKRDSLVAAHPGLAVNLVSMWEWTDKAKRTKKMVNQTGTPYRSGGSAEDLARHHTYQQMGYIQPVTPGDLAKRIIGTIMDAKSQSARDLYTEVVSQVNDQRWEYVVTDEWKTWLDQVAAYTSKSGDLPYRTGRELWANYSQLKQLYDFEFPPEEGKTGFTIPQKMLAWGESYPSGPDDLRKAFEEGYPIPLVTDKMREMADALGINIGEDGMTEVGEVYQAVADIVANDLLENPMYVHVSDDFLAWSGQRGAGTQAVAKTMGVVLDSSAFTTETRWEYKKTLILLDEVMKRRSENDPSWLELRDEAVDRYMQIFQDDAFRTLDAWELWDQGYAKSLGALDWEPYEPPPLMVDGQPNELASTVYVKKVLDGDTVDITFGGGIVAQEYNRVRLLGYNAQELGQGGEAEKEKLTKAIEEAVRNGVPITIVRDPRFGNTDMYGRMFAWLYIGTEPWYNPDTMIPRRS